MEHRSAFLLTTAGRRRPQLLELVAGEIDFDFLSRQTTPAFDGERMTPARFAQTNLGAVGFHREITLLNGTTVKVPQIRRQFLKQKFPFDLTRNFAVTGLNIAGHKTIFS